MSADIVSVVYSVSAAVPAPQQLKEEKREKEERGREGREEGREREGGETEGGKREGGRRREGDRESTSILYMHLSSLYILCNVMYFSAVFISDNISLQNITLTPPI